MPPPCGDGACWYWPAKLYSPKVRRICSSISGGSRSGCKASPALRRKDCRPNTVSTRCHSSSSEIADKRTTSNPPVPAHGARGCPSGEARGQALVQPVHDQHDRTRQLVVEPAVKGVVVPLIGS